MEQEVVAGNKHRDSTQNTFENDAFCQTCLLSAEDYGKGEQARKDEIAESGFAELIFSAIVHASVCNSEFGIRISERGKNKQVPNPSEIKPS